MRPRARCVISLSLTLALLGLSKTICAASEAQLQLKVKTPRVVVGQEVAVEVMVKHAPTIYGADVRLAFDPSLLEVVDADETIDGVQLEPGEFIDPGHSFFLQHKADNEAGTIDYALTLLHPAPPAEGNGPLLRVTFRARAEGQATISIEEGLFGTQTGETIAPALDSAEIRIVASRDGQSGEERSLLALQALTDIIAGSSGTVANADGFPGSSAGQTVLGLGLGLASAAAGTGLVGGWLWIKRV